MKNTERCILNTPLIERASKTAAIKNKRCATQLKI